MKYEELLIGATFAPILSPKMSQSAGPIITIIPLSKTAMVQVHKAYVKITGQTYENVTIKVELTASSIMNSLRNF